MEASLFSIRVIINFICFDQAKAEEARKSVGAEKKIFVRRKSELPHDVGTLNALEGHKRADEFMSTTLETS